MKANTRDSETEVDTDVVFLGPPLPPPLLIFCRRLKQLQSCRRRHRRGGCDLHNNAILLFLHQSIESKW